MALKITRSTEPMTVDRLVMCIYAPPGLGKTTLSFTSRRPLLLDFDEGAHRAANRGDAVSVAQWGDVIGMTAEDVADYDTLIVDTAGRALDKLAADIIRRNPKMGRGGSLSLQGYGQLKTEFAAWVRHVRELRKDLILIAHASEEKSGDEIIERIDMQGGSKQELYKVADAMGRLVMTPGNALPTLTFSPSDTAFGKNPGQLEPLQVPHCEKEPQFLAGVMDSIKDRLNALTEAQQERLQAIAQWRDRIDAIEDVEAMNELLREARVIEEDYAKTVKGALYKRATEGLGMVYDEESQSFVEQEAAA